MFVLHPESTMTLAFDRLDDLRRSGAASRRGIAVRGRWRRPGSAVPVVVSGRGDGRRERHRGLNPVGQRGPIERSHVETWSIQP